jgi:hypothetical protein
MASNSTLKLLDFRNPEVILLLDQHPFSATLLAEYPRAAEAFYRESLAGMRLFCCSSELSQNRQVSFWEHPSNIYEKTIS